MIYNSVTELCSIILNRKSLVFLLGNKIGLQDQESLVYLDKLDIQFILLNLKYENEQT